MKKLLIILAFILPVTAKSQDTIKIPAIIAKSIAKELVVCDSAKAILDLTKQELSLTQNKVVVKDSIISNHIKKETIYKQVITNQEQKFDLQNQLITDLKSQNKKLKIKLRLTQIFSTVFIGFITYIYVVK
jgi:hypothetical protein